ncbi:hypothetical protein, partial [Bosea sp. (in: a-proteobacteria)]|uniref:hypothetical protein n=1 Tax=Bosea sp. (in: a-proteobacteria) TaxID=1871050 RepID=UPI003F703DCE
RATLDRRASYRTQGDDLSLCFSIGFFRKADSTFRSDALASTPEHTEPAQEAGSFLIAQL